MKYKPESDFSPAAMGHRFLGTAVFALPVDLFVITGACRGGGIYLAFGASGWLWLGLALILVPVIFGVLGIFWQDRILDFLRSTYEDKPTREY